MNYTSIIHTCPPSNVTRAERLASHVKHKNSSKSKKKVEQSHLFGDQLIINNALKV